VTELTPHAGQAVMAFKGSVDTLIDSVWNYPSYAEAYRVAAFSALAKCRK
jgi:NAD(P) transhydrogenase